MLEITVIRITSVFIDHFAFAMFFAVLKLPIMFGSISEGHHFLAMRKVISTIVSRQRACKKISCQSN